MSIRLKLILVLSAVLVVAFVATSLMTFFVSREDYRISATEEVLPLLTNTILLEVQRDLMRPIDISSLMANDTFLRDWVVAGEQDAKLITNYLSRIKNDYGFFTAFFVSEATGYYYYYDGILKTISREDPHDIWYYDFTEKGAAVNLDVDADEASAGTLTIFINHRVLDDKGNLIGVTGVGLAMSGVSELLMVNSDGIVQAHPDISRVESMSITDTLGISSVASAILEQQGEANYEFDRSGKRVFAEARFFPEFEWYLIGEQEPGASLRHIRSALLSSLSIGLLATLIVIFIVVLVVNRYQGHLEALVSVDPLTGVANRRYFMEKLQAEFARSQRYRADLSLIMIDVDRFKRVNDQYGHLTGDRLLAALAQDIQGALRESDTLGRVGGEEFAVVLPETQLAEATLVAERIRKSVCQQPVRTIDGGGSPTTVSIGVASVHDDTAGHEELYRLADAALYHAKDQGRNCVCVDEQLG